VFASVPRLLAALALVACVTTEPEPLHPPPAAGPVLVVTRDGAVRGADASFALGDADQREALTRALTRLDEASAEPLVFRSQRGTPFAVVEDLLALLDAAGIEDYRVDLNAADG